MATSIKSPSFSLAGWSIWEWFKGNWKTIKEGLKVFAPMFLASLASSDPRIIGALTIAGKFLLDLAEYFVKQY